MVGVYDSHCIPFFSVIGTFFDLTRGNLNILIILVFQYPFFPLNWVIKLSLSWATVSHTVIMKQRILENDEHNIFGQDEHSIEFVELF